MSPLIHRLALIPATVLVVSLAPASAEAIPEVAPTPAAAINWQPCPEDKTAECGVLRVPVDWAGARANQPAGKTFGLALARRKATDPARRIGMLVVNSGGPSNSGVDFAIAAADTFSPEVRSRFDIVGFDPRGAARSHPVKCSAELISHAPLDSPHNAAEFAQLLAFNAELGADCRRHAGPVIDHLDTINVVGDVEAIRVALGEKKVNFYGVGYGTLLGQQYAEMFGQNIRAMVLDSNMDHSVGTRKYLLTQAATAEDSFNEFVTWCARESVCALHGKNVGAIWDALLAKADSGELLDPANPSSGPVLSVDLTFTAFDAFFTGDVIPFSEYVARLSGQADAGSASLTRSRTRAAQAGALVENSFQAEFCQDWQYDVKNYQQFASLIAASRRVAPHMRGAPGAEIALTTCLGWPTKVTNPQHRLKIRNAPPLLMLNGLHDPSTGYNWATNVHQQIKDTAVLVTYLGLGRGVYGRGPCTVRVTDRYLINRVVPAEGTQCPAIPPPGSTARGTAVPSERRW